MVDIVTLILFVMSNIDMIYRTCLDAGMRSTAPHFKDYLVVEKSVSAYSEIILETFIIPKAIIHKESFIKYLIL